MHARHMPSMPMLLKNFWLGWETALARAICLPNWSARRSWRSALNSICAGERSNRLCPLHPAMEMNAGHAPAFSPPDLYSIVLEAVFELSACFVDNSNTASYAGNPVNTHSAHSPELAPGLARGLQGSSCFHTDEDSPQLAARNLQLSPA